MSLPPVHARPSPPAEPSGVKGRPGQEDASAGSGTPFDILLAERGGAAPLPLAGQDLDADRRQGRAVPTVAEVFNEHGFFAGAAPLGSQSPGAPASPQAGGVSVEPAFAHPASAAPRGGAMALPAGGAAPVIAEARLAMADAALSEGAVRLDGFGGPFLARFAGSPTGAPAVPRAAMQSAPRIAASIARAASTGASSPSTADGSTFASRAGKRLAARVEEHLRRAGGTAIRVDVRASQDGLLVAARAEGLDRAERSRLRAEIEALLVRHGHAPARISLNGEPAPPRRA
ncbi:MAG TPA: hypothetical protein VEZ48_13285 [Sphingomonadaceae bacterium]|nr:hypothetical protein [Sphingomonadaceae bacterium]